MTDVDGFAQFQLPDAARFWLPDPQHYAIQQERDRHTEALYGYGEYGMFTLMWRVGDHEAGLVDRCQRCYKNYGKMAEAYGQPAQHRCPECFGTTFEGGFKAQIIRPSMWNISATDYQDHARGEVVASQATLQTTNDFLFRRGDYAFRADGTRWQIQSMDPTWIETGFETTTDARGLIGLHLSDVTLEDPSSVAYMIPPLTTTALTTLLTRINNHPTDHAATDIIRGPLL